MTDDKKLALLSKALMVFGVIFMFGVFAMMRFIHPAGWSWEPAQPEYELMIMGMYFVLGFYMFRAAKNPMKHLSLIGFAAWSSFVHAAIMAYQAFVDPAETPNFYGDIPALFLVWAVLLYLTPKDAN